MRRVRKGGVLVRDAPNVPEPGQAVVKRPSRLATCSGIVRRIDVGSANGPSRHLNEGGALCRGEVVCLRRHLPLSPAFIAFAFDA